MPNGHCDRQVTTAVHIIRLERYYNSKWNQLACIKNWKVLLLLRQYSKGTFTVGQIILRLYAKSQQERGNEAILLIEPVLHLNKSQANEVGFYLQNKFMYITMIFKVLLYESVNLLIRGSPGFKAYAK
jgi:hypothetical protein